MALRSGSLSRTLMSTVRSSSSRLTPLAPQLRPPPVSAPRRLPGRHFSAASRYLKVEWDQTQPYAAICEGTHEELIRQELML